MKNEKGFTLIEVTTAISILAILFLGFFAAINGTMRLMSHSSELRRLAEANFSATEEGNGTMLNGNAKFTIGSETIVIRGTYIYNGESTSKMIKFAGD